MTGGIKAAKKPWRQDADDAVGDARLSALPDAVLQHALGFLPSRDAVRTCVLGRRWVNLWRALPRLRITDVPTLGCGDRLELFVNQLLLRRDPGATLDECEIDLSTLGDRPWFTYMDLWLRHALLLRTRVMRLCFNLVACGLSDGPLVSTFLRVLHIDRMCTEIPDVMDFSRCPALEDLEITSSIFMSSFKLIAPSAKRLCFVKCFFGATEGLSTEHERSCISAQSLTWLKIEEGTGLAPVLGSMPSLQTASIWFGCCFEDKCEKPCSAGSCCDDECLNCYKYLADLMHRCVLLRGLSNATSLRFRASFGMFSFKKDLKWCPTFCNLKTFYLVDWCLVGDLGALHSFLQPTPNLEKLTLQVCQREKCALEAENYSPTEQPIELGHLKIFEMKCVKIDERVQRTFKLIFGTLVTTNLKQINIQII